MAAWTAQARPYIDATGTPLRLSYQCLDATDQILYDTFDRPSDRNAFLQMIRDWKNETNELRGNPPATGADIRMRWNLRKKYLIKVWTKRRPKHAAAATAVPHPPVPPPPPRLQAQHHLQEAETQDAVTHTTSIVTPGNNQQPLSPIQTPLAELSPRFICQGDWPDHALSPTLGQSKAIAGDLHGNWRFGDVAYQEAPPPGPHVSMAPLKSMYLCVRSDDSGTIQEQVAVKCFEVNEMTEQTYGEQSQKVPHEQIDKHAIYEIHDSDAKNEINICQRIGLARCSHITQYRGNGVRDLVHSVVRSGEADAEAFGQRTVHLYQSWAGRGDLDNLIRQHRRLKRPINEHFIWYTLRELTEALIALKYGPGSCTSARAELIDVPGSAKYTVDLSEPWVPILHLDVKTDNVVLEAPGDNAEYPAYPRPVLCDFGLSQLASDEFIYGTSADVLDLRFSGTVGWLPPERSHADHDPVVGTIIDKGYSPHYWPLSEKTDVWGLGLIAQKMMFAHHTDTIRADDGSRETVSIECRTLSNVNEWGKVLRNSENLQDSHYEPDFHLGPECYSTGLHRLAVDCLWHDMSERPGLLELRGRIDAGLARLEGLYGENLKKRKRDPEDALNILTCDEEGHPFETFEIGKKYRPKRKHHRLELDESGLDHFEYGKIVRDWDGMDPKPRVAAQDTMTERIGFYLSHAPQVNDFDNHRAKAWEWSAKHLISCLRKRTSENPRCYVLTHKEIVEQDGMIRDGSENIDAFEIDIKLEILEYLRNEPSLRKDEKVVATGAGSVAFMEHVIEWALFLVSKCHKENRTAQPKGQGQEMQDLSELHQGLFDWIFVKPSGAFVMS